MKILIWNECYVSGGADWSLIDLINSWPNKDDKFNLFVNKSHEGLNLLKKKINYNKFNVFNTLLESKILNFLKKKNNKSILFKILKKITIIYLIINYFFEYLVKIFNSKFDLVLINNGGYPGAQSAYIISFICKIFRRKKVFMIVRNYPSDSVDNSFYMKIISLIVNLFIDKVILVSDSLKGEMIKKSGIKIKKLVRIYNGINVKSKFSKEIKFNFKENSIGIIGNLENRKGHDVLINSLPKIIKKFPLIKLYIIGSTSNINKKNLDILIENLKINDNVEWIPYQNNIENIYRGLKIVVMPSKNYESFGRIAVEAMAFKKPIVASNVGGLKEIISNKHDGFLFDNGDSNKLADIILEILNNNDLYDNLIKNGYKKFRLNFTSDIMSKNYYNLLNSE